MFVKSKQHYTTQLSFFFVFSEQGKVVKYIKAKKKLCENILH